MLIEELQQFVDKVGLQSRWSVEMTVDSVTLRRHQISLPAGEDRPLMAAFICHGQKNCASSRYNAMALCQARQSYPGSGTRQLPSVSTFPTVGVICIIKAEGRPYTTSGKQYSSTEYKSPKNCRYFPESQTYGIFQGTHVFNCHTF